MDTNSQFGNGPTIPQPAMTQPPMNPPSKAQPPTTQPPTFPPLGQTPRRHGGAGVALRVVALALVTLAALGVAAMSLPGAVAQARVVAYPPPAVSITSPQTDGTIRVGDTINFNAQVHAGTDLTLDWDFGDGSSGHGAHVNHSYADYGGDGTYTVTLVANDPIGQTAQTEVSVHVLPPMPTASFTATGRPDDPFTVDFDATTASTGTRLSCYWDFGDGQTDNSGACQTYNQYQKLGKYTVKLTIQDIANQQASTSQSVSVSIPKPVASFSYSTDGFGCVSVDASNSSGYQLTYQWDYGDGSSDTSYGSGDSHCYFNSGTYTITLVVVDAGGQRSRTAHNVSV